MHYKEGMTAAQYQSKYGKDGKPLKHRNIPTVFAGIRFDSKKEVKRYKELLILEQQGLILKFQRQVKYTLLEAVPKLFKEKYYRADFVVYNLDGTIDVEDVKSPDTKKLPHYQIHKHLMWTIHNILIVEK